MKNAIASAVFLYQKDKKLLFTTSTTFVVQGFDIFHRHKIACNDVNDKNKKNRTTNVRKNENSSIISFVYATIKIIRHFRQSS